MRRKIIKKGMLSVLFAICFICIFMLTGCIEPVFFEDGYVCRRKKWSDEYGEVVDIISFRPDVWSRRSMARIPIRIRDCFVDNVYFSEEVTEWTESFRIYWNGGKPVGWENLKITGELLNVFIQKEKPEWLGSKEHFLPGKIACPEIFRKNYLDLGLDLFIPTKSITFHYNYEGAPNSDVWWYYPFFDNQETPQIICTYIDEPRRKKDFEDYSIHYTFLGWYNEPECINYCDLNSFIPMAEVNEGEERQLYARWK